MRDNPPHSNSRKERRRHPRYTAKDRTFAFWGATPYVIVDISESGMAVNYIALRNKPAAPYFFDLFHPPRRAYLPAIPGKIIAEVAPDPIPMFCTLQTKRLCIQFDPLTATQQSLLRSFIRQVKR